jgi:Domain of unknown function (DUF4388)
VYKGRLDELSLLDICRLIRNADAEGVLKVRGAFFTGSIAFVKGSIPYARSGRVHAGYGRDLVARGALTQDQMERAVRMCVLGDESLESLLVSSGLISQSSLEKALRREIINAALDQMRWRQGDFFFVEGERIEGNFPVTVTVDELIEKAQQLDVVERYSVAVPQLVGPTAVGLGAVKSLWNISALEREILTGVDGQRTLGEIAKLRRLGMLTVLEGVADLLNHDLVELRFEAEEVIDLRDPQPAEFVDRVAQL